MTIKYFKHWCLFQFCLSHLTKKETDKMQLEFHSCLKNAMGQHPFRKPTYPQIIFILVYRLSGLGGKKGGNLCREMIHC